MRQRRRSQPVAGWRRFAIGVALVSALLPASTGAETPDPALRGHGGPIRSLAVLDDGRTIVTGGFDSAIIVWDIESGRARKVLRLHASAVSALAPLGEACFASGGDDGVTAIWCGDGERPLEDGKIHSGLIAGLAVAADRRRLASASWDRRARVQAIAPAGSGPRIGREHEAAALSLEHQAPVNGVAILPAGPGAGEAERIVTITHDGEIRVTAPEPAAGAMGIRAQRRLPVALNGLAVLPDGRLVVTAADGVVRVLTGSLEPLFELELADGPLTAVAVAPDGGTIAVAGMRTPVVLIDIQRRAVVRRILGPGLPVWALAFSLDGRVLFTGGADAALRRWQVATGEPAGVVAAGSDDGSAGMPTSGDGPGVFRACAACHTTREGEGHRAGPTLAGIFGRRIATAPGYAYSDAVKRLDLIWTPETISKLFEVGPEAYTPGSKMPEQRITDPADRKALVDWLARVTGP